MVVGATPAYLTQIFKDNTTLQAEEMVAQYIGNWIEIAGTFNDVRSPTDVFDLETETARKTMAVSLDVSLTAPDANMSFDAERWRPHLVQLVRGQEIHVRCRISRVSRSGIDLENCELIDPISREVIKDVAR